MLTRLFVNGFKNLVETEVYFGPFTCLAGLNGVGKSNLLDAIHFLSLLVDLDFHEASDRIRGGDHFTSLFTQTGSIYDLSSCTDTMTFECDMIIPPKGLDGYKQEIKASATFLTYQVVLGLMMDPEDPPTDAPYMVLFSESLKSIPLSEAYKHLHFPYEKVWFDSVIKGDARDFISTERANWKTPFENDICLWKDGVDGRELISSVVQCRASTTLISGQKTGKDVATLLLAAEEMRSWKQLHLDPNALRKPASVRAIPHLEADGKNLPAVMSRLAKSDKTGRFFARITNDLSQIIDNVKWVTLEKDDFSNKYRIVLENRRGAALYGSSLSDGTLRFLALVTMANDPLFKNLLCIEEPENGIHPERLKAVLELLDDMSVDTRYPIGEDNPMSQIIITTHSPVLVAHCDPNDLVFTANRDAPGYKPGTLSSFVGWPVEGTWRCLNGIRPLAMGQVMSYLSSLKPEDQEQTTFGLSESFRNRDYSEASE